MGSRENFIPVLAVVCAAVLVCGCTGGDSEIPTLTAEEKELAIIPMEGYAGVQDADLGQDGKQLSLAIIVDYGTSEEYAKELGDSFVRLVKSFGPEERPGKEIGPGIYDYLVGVYYPNGDLVAIGAKVAGARGLTW
ncbi:MAG: hypothetical protein PHN90_10515 [Methanothrix sp.]|jgi:hypothetical protein|nr:hypothetical protein [Methanothrix sp.]